MDRFRLEISWFWKRVVEETESLSTPSCNLEKIGSRECTFTIEYAPICPNFSSLFAPFLDRMGEMLKKFQQGAFQ